MVSYCGAGAWLYRMASGEWISADLWEVVAHLRRVRDDALYKYTVNLLCFATVAVIRISVKTCLIMFLFVYHKCFSTTLPVFLQLKYLLNLKS